MCAPFYASASKASHIFLTPEFYFRNRNVVITWERGLARGVIISRLPRGADTRVYKLLCTMELHTESTPYYGYFSLFLHYIYYFGLLLREWTIYRMNNGEKSTAIAGWNCHRWAIMDAFAILTSSSSTLENWRYFSIILAPLGLKLLIFFGKCFEFAYSPRNHWFRALLWQYVSFNNLLHSHSRTGRLWCS